MILGVFPRDRCPPAAHQIMGAGATNSLDGETPPKTTPPRAAKRGQSK